MNFAGMVPYGLAAGGLVAIGYGYRVLKGGTVEPVKESKEAFTPPEADPSALSVAGKLPQVIKAPTPIGTGRSLDQDKGMVTYDIRIPFANRPAHVVIFGASGSGKTRLSENIMEHDIRSGCNLVYMDPKIDQDAAAKIVQTAIACGRKDDLMFINTVFPEYSAVINPCAHYFVHEELVEHCVAGIKESKDPFFRDAGKEIVSSIVTGLKILAEAGVDITLLKPQKGAKPKAKEKPKQDVDQQASGEPLQEEPTKRRFETNLMQIKEFTSREDLSRLAEILKGVTTREAEDCYNDIQRILQTGEEFYAKVATSLRVALGELTSGNIGKLIGRADENRFIKKLEEGRSVILVCQLGEPIVHDAAFTLGKVIVSMIQSCVGRIISSSREKLSPPLMIHIDEAPQVIWAGIESFLAQVRSAECCVTMYAQNVNQFYDKLGEPCAKACLGNLNTKIFMRTPDADTAEYVARHFGTVKKLSPVIGAGGQITGREVDEDVVLPFHVISLQPREFFMLSYQDRGTKGRWKGRTSDTTKARVKIRYPDAPSQ